MNEGGTAMSTATKLLAESSPDWLPPVHYDFDGYRRFSRQMDASLSELEQAHEPRREPSAIRLTIILVEPTEPVEEKGESQLPSA